MVADAERAKVMHRQDLERCWVEAMKTNARQEAIINSLVYIRKAETGGTPLVSNQGQALDGYSALANYQAIADKAVELEEG